MPAVDLAPWQTGPPPTPHWLLPGILTHGSLVLLAGREGAGKSMFSYALAVAAAAGAPFLGRPLTPMPVLYFDEENSHDTSHAYFWRTWVGLGRPPLDHRLRLEQFSLGQGWQNTLLDLCQRYQPTLVFLDTVTPACDIVEENSNAEASRACRAIRRAQLAAGPGCTMILLKHLRQRPREDGGGFDIRGAKHWKGAVDAILHYKDGRGQPPKDGLRTMTLTSAKTRAWGLSEDLHIRPRRAADESLLFSLA